MSGFIGAEPGTTENPAGGVPGGMVFARSNAWPIVAFDLYALWSLLPDERVATNIPGFPSARARRGPPVSDDSHSCVTSNCPVLTKNRQLETAGPHPNLCTDPVRIGDGRSHSS